MAKRFKLSVFVPQSHVENVRTAIINAGAGKIGNYDNCAFMSSGIGTFRPLKGAKPFSGQIGKLERVGEAKIETTVEEGNLKDVIKAMKKAHPYEEPAYDCIRLEEI